VPAATTAEEAAAATADAGANKQPELVAA
jgi:hypothetical protein